jgi:hypothetical protein
MDDAQIQRLIEQMKKNGVGAPGAPGPGAPK